MQKDSTMNAAPGEALAHYTTMTDHLRMSPRSEVQPEVISSLMKWLDAAETQWMADAACRKRVAQVPHSEGYALRFDAEGTTLQAELIHEECGPCVRFAVGCDASGDAAWAAMTARPRPSLPWCAASLDLGALAMAFHDPQQLLWFGDFERCVAWAWIELVKTQGGFTDMQKAA
jgi:hypothetical protein